MPEIERRLFSPWAVLAHAALTLLAVFCSGIVGAALGDVGRGTTHLVLAVLFGVAAVAAVVPTVRRALRNRALVTELLAWEAAERRERYLPGEDVRPEHRMPFDARADPDFEQVAAAAGTAAYLRSRGHGQYLRAALSGMGVVAGFVLVAGGFLGAPEPLSIGMAVGGGYLLGCSLVTAVSATRIAWRYSRISAAVEADIREVRAGR
jgi:hypothetical protein